MASSGIRLGAWDYLLWKLISPINNQPLGNSCEQLVDWIKNLMQNQGRATGIRKNPKLNNDKRKAFTLTKVSLRVSLHKKFLHELESVIEH